MAKQEFRISEDDPPRNGDVYRHTRRGSSYTVVGRASLQTANLVRDNEVLVIYKGENGELWARPIQEFCDGRFELLPGEAETS